MNQRFARIYRVHKHVLFCKKFFLCFAMKRQFQNRIQFENKDSVFVILTLFFDSFCTMSKNALKGLNLAVFGVQSAACVQLLRAKQYKSLTNV